MKRNILLTLIAAFVLAMPAQAQFYPNGRPIPPSKRGGIHMSYPRASRFFSGTYYGFRLGMGVATVNSDSPVLDATSAKAGLNVGFVVGTPIAYSAPLFFETGLYYTEKGGKSTYDGSKFTCSLNYLELPLLLKYRHFTYSGVSVEPFVGGYLACGVGGKIKDYGTRQAYSSFGNDYSEAFNRFDAGLKLGCGVGFDMLYVEASYDIGLANVGKDSFDDTHTGCLNLTLGLNF